MSTTVVVLSSSGGVLCGGALLTWVVRKWSYRGKHRRRRGRHRAPTSTTG